MPPPCNSSIHVLDNGVWAVSAAGGFRVPRALVILALDGVRVAEDFLTPTRCRREHHFFAPSSLANVPKTQGPLGSQAEWPLGRTVLRFRSPSE